MTLTKTRECKSSSREIMRRRRIQRQRRSTKSPAVGGYTKEKPGNPEKPRNPGNLGNKTSFVIRIIY